MKRVCVIFLFRVCNIGELKNDRFVDPYFLFRRSDESCQVKNKFLKRIYKFQPSFFLYFLIGNFETGVF